MPELIIHLGLHKTATGTLQRQFFPSCDELELFTTLIPEMKKFIELVTKKDPIHFNSTKALENLAPLLNEKKVNLISNESLSGPPWAGVIELSLDHRTPILENLRSVFPDARIIIVLRRQDALARSFYREYLKNGGTRKVRRFYGMEKNAQHPPLMSLDRFMFSQYIEAIHNYFPKGVLILTFEEFILQPSVFLKKITDFMGIECPNIILKKENSTNFGSLGLEINRILNFIFRSQLNPSGFIPGFNAAKFGKKQRLNLLQHLHDKWPGKGTISNECEIHKVSQEIYNKVKEGNRKLDSLYEIDLGKYNYYD